VSCTGAQFCGIALIETKQRAMDVVQKLEAQLDIPRGIRMHWTGCPNSCGQVHDSACGAEDNIRLYTNEKLCQKSWKHSWTTRPASACTGLAAPTLAARRGFRGSLFKTKMRRWASSENPKTTWQLRAHPDARHPHALDQPGACPICWSCHRSKTIVRSPSRRRKWRTSD